MAEKKPEEGNQTEKEFFAIVETGRKGVEQMFASRPGQEIRDLAAPNVAGQYDTWAKRALVHVTSKEELKPVLQTKTGIWSIYQELAKAAQLGLQVGGQFPHGYLVPKGGKAVLMITATGYAFAAVHGPGAVLRHIPPLVEVYEKDSFRVDQAAGKYQHEFSPFTDRGKLVGYFMRLEYRDGRIEIPVISFEKVKKIADGYSTKSSPAWSKSAEEMYAKIAAKQLLKKPIREAEGIAMQLDADAPEEPEEPAAPPPRDVTQRVGSRLDRATEAMASSVEQEKIEVDYEVVEDEAEHGDSEPEPEDPPPAAAKAEGKQPVDAAKGKSELDIF